MYPDQITGVLTTSIYVRKGCMCLAGAIEKLCILMNYLTKKYKMAWDKPFGNESSPTCEKDYF